MEELEYTNTAVQEKLVKCRQMQQYATQGGDRGRIMEACNNAMKLIGEAEQEVLKMSTMAKQLESNEQQRALEMVNSTRAEIATLKSQITQIQDQNISPDLSVTMSGHEQQTQRLADQSATAKALLGQAADQSKAGVDELKRQNEQTDNLI